MVNLSWRLNETESLNWNFAYLSSVWALETRKGTSVRNARCVAVCAYRQRRARVRIVDTEQSNTKRLRQELELAMKKCAIQTQFRAEAMKALRDQAETRSAAQSVRRLLDVVDDKDREILALTAKLQLVENKRAASPMTSPASNMSTPPEQPPTVMLNDNKESLETEVMTQKSMIEAKEAQLKQLDTLIDEISVRGPTAVNNDSPSSPSPPTQVQSQLLFQVRLSKIPISHPAFF